MTPLGAYALSLILYQFPPGYSQASLERLPDCGEDPAVLSCPSSPSSPLPLWLDGLGWVRQETREAGARRLEVVAEAAADAALFYGAGWREGPRDLLRSTIAAGGWGMGFHESTQVGRTRGPSGEVCLMDLLPSTLRGASPFDRQKLSDKELADGVLGLDYESQRRCFDAGSLLLVRARRDAERLCKSTPWEYATFALYATGSSCTTVRSVKNKETGKFEFKDWLAGPRYSSLRKFRARKETVFPSWYAPRL